MDNEEGSDSCILFQHRSATTVDSRRGVKSAVPIRTTDNGAVRITVSLAITTAGAMMSSPCIVMKGKQM